MAKKPGLFDSFRGLWVRGHVDNTPPDHFSACINTAYVAAGVSSGDSTTQYNAFANGVRMALYKPTPPFTGTKIPREIVLRSNGDLVDLLLDTVIYSNPLMLDFGFVNFFGRMYFSPSDGKVGLENEVVRVYDGTGVSRPAGGTSPTVPITGAYVVGTAAMDPGTYLVSYAFETASGFITPPAEPFVGVDVLGTGTIQGTLPLGPAGTVARWIISTKSFALGSIGSLGGPWQVDRARNTPIYYVDRIANNTDTTYSVNFFDEQLVDLANDLFTRLTTIPAGVGLIDYKGRMGSYGEFANPSLFRLSEIGEPESFSATSGFLITDPSDSTGIRSAVEFRNILHFFKRHRGYITEDNGLSPSTWEVVNFEKALGTEHYGIGAVLDAKGSQSNGFIIASIGALYFYNGTVVEPELSYKIRDLWSQINPHKFHLVQVAIDPDVKRIYILIPKGVSNDVDFIIFGDYRDGLDAMNIKWSLWQYESNPRSILIYESFASGAENETVVTRLARSNKIVTLNVGVPGNDDGVTLESNFTLAPLRFSSGVSQFTRVRIRATGPCHIEFEAAGEDGIPNVPLVDLVVPSDIPAREYTIPFNLVSEQCRLHIDCEAGEFYKINFIHIDGQPLWDERPR